MSRFFVLILALAVCVGFVSRASAYPDGERVTLTPSAGYFLLSERSNVDVGPFLGGGIGFMFGRHWGVEGTVGYVNGAKLLQYSDVPVLAEGNEVDVRFLSIDLRYELFHDSALSPYFLAGWQQFRFTPAATGRDAGLNVQQTYQGLESGLGLLVELSESEFHRVQARVEGRYLFTGFDEPYIDTSESGHSFLLTGGLQVEFGDDWHRDSDADGIIDRFDDCPETDTRVVVDARGCPIDSDGDAIFDGIDVSPDTPLGAVVDSLGTPLDEDQDGVYDGLDQCPTPIGAIVDERGCGIDTDGDTIFDGIDQCPGTPSGVSIDAVGCPRVDSEAERTFYETGLLVLSDIEFESGKAEMRAGGTALLRPMAQYLRKWPDMRLEVGGHTDDRGELEANQRLSQERAQTVVRYLVDNFDWIDASQLRAVGYGEEKPVADNATEEGRTQNRRVEFKILAGQPELPE